MSDLPDSSTEFVDGIANGWIKKERTPKLKCRKNNKPVSLKRIAQAHLARTMVILSFVDTDADKIRADIVIVMDIQQNSAHADTVRIMAVRTNCPNGRGHKGATYDIQGTYAGLMPKVFALPSEPEKLLRSLRDMTVKGYRKAYSKTSRK